MDIHQRICELFEQGKVCAVIQVLAAQGSTPLKAGAKAVVAQDGQIWGTIGGGAVEAEAQQRAVQACKSDKAEVFDFDMHGAHTFDNEPVCGGSMRVLVVPIATQHKQTYAQVAVAMQTRDSGVLVTRISSDTPADVAIEWVSSNAVDHHAVCSDSEVLKTCLKTQTPALMTGQAPWSEVFIEPVFPRPHLVIAGGGHVGQALAHQAVLVGFDVTVVDDRHVFTHGHLYPSQVTTQCGDMADAVKALDLTSDTFIVIVTRGHQSDAHVLEACINQPAGYIGMIGSRRKIGVIRNHMIESGITTEERFDRIHAPIGLDIGAVTASEIAASIVAQLIEVRRKGPVS